MPEKAIKMQGWIIVGRYMESRYDQPTYSKWIVAGAAAGAATTLIGKPHIHVASSHDNIVINKCIVCCLVHKGCVCSPSIQVCECLISFHIMSQGVHLREPWF